MTALTPLWNAYADKLRHYEGGLFDAGHLALHRRWIETIPDWWSRIDALPKTLIYNDAQIRNLAVRSPGTQPRLVLFDWECTSIQLPQRDLVEFLSYAISDRISDAEILGFLEAARVELARRTHRNIDRRAWLDGCRLSIRDLHVNRMACQLVLHITLNRPDIERVFRASMRILRVLGETD
jgi:thiamine kinase-like enzyme